MSIFVSCWKAPRLEDVSEAWYHASRNVVVGRLGDLIDD